MQGMGDVVLVKYLECLFVGDKVDIESYVMCMLLGGLGLEVWDRGELLGV